MQIFLDSANPDDLLRFTRYGIIDGVTTNPALIARNGGDFLKIVREICRIVKGPVSAEVVSESGEKMIHEAKRISAIHKNIVVKLPATKEGFYALNKVSKLGIKTNFTVVYTANQALLAAKLGATYVSPFIGRLDASSTNGADLIIEIRRIYDNYKFKTKILAASMRNVIYVKEAALAGADAATIPSDVLESLMISEMSEVGVQGFLSEWKKLPANKRQYFEPKTKT